MSSARVGSSILNAAKSASKSRTIASTRPSSSHCAFSSSPVVAATSANHPHTTPADRAKIIESAWSRPHKPSQDADDNVVPSYYIERKRQRDEISERKEAEGGLMAQLAAGILSEGIAAQTRVREEKIPVEVRLEDGSVRHPSGFEPPTPETDFHPVSSKIAVEDEPHLSTVKIPWDEALAPEDAFPPSSTAASSTSGVRGYHSKASSRRWLSRNRPAL